MLASSIAPRSKEKPQQFPAGASPILFLTPDYQREPRF